MSNVIKADFGTRANTRTGISFTPKILYLDDEVCLFRVAYTVNGKPHDKLPVQFVTVALNN